MSRSLHATARTSFHLVQMADDRASVRRAIVNLVNLASVTPLGQSSSVNRMPGSFRRSPRRAANQYSAADVHDPSGGARAVCRDKMAKLVCVGEETVETAETAETVVSAENADEVRVHHLNKEVGQRAALQKSRDKSCEPPREPVILLERRLRDVTNELDHVRNEVSVLRQVNGSI